MSDTDRVSEETLRIDPAAWMVHAGGHTVQLTYLEFRLLLFLAEHPGKVFGRGELLQEVWAAERGVSNRTVDLYIHRLREKLGNVGRRAIKTVIRVGYRFELKDAGAQRLPTRSPPEAMDKV